MAMYHAIKEIVLLRKLLEDMGAEQEGPTPLFFNTEAAIGMANNPILNGLNKHMKIKWHWVRQMVKEWSLRRPVYGLRHASREQHDTLRTTLAALGFAPLSTDPSLLLRTDTSLPPFYSLVYVDDLVFATVDTESLAVVKAELQKRHTCTNLGPSAFPLSPHSQSPVSLLRQPRMTPWRSSSSSPPPVAVRPSDGGRGCRPIDADGVPTGSDSAEISRSEAASTVSRLPPLTA
ncbi:unnamed protein product [Closterium sp. NIES-53]